MKLTQDIYTTILGLRSQIEKAEGTIESVQSNYNSIYSHIENDVASFEKRKGEIDDELDRLKKLIASLCSTRNDYISSEQKSSVVCEEKKEELNDDINNLKEIIFEPAQQIINTMQPVIANDIYDKCDRLRDIFDLFETRIWNQVRQPGQQEFFPNGLTNKNHLRIFLMGEFSSGKTTFIQRVLNQKAGEIAAGPTTGLLVIHKVSNDESLEVICNDQFEIESNQRFITFLQRWYIASDFTQVGNVWMFKNPDTRITLNPMFTSSQIMQFTAEANLYPQAFKEIIWTHRKKADTNPVFEFADLYDMPGIGSSTQQHMQSINYTLQKYSPDIIFYLVDSGNAIPSSTGTELLNHILDEISNSDNKPVFFWVYEKPTGNEKNEWRISLASDGQISFDTSFLSEMKTAIKNYIDKPHTNENDFEFSPVNKNYLYNSNILDIRGPKNQITETITNAIAFAIQRYYCKQVSDCIIYIDMAFKGTEKKDNMFNSSNTQEASEFLKEIIDEIIETAKKQTPPEIYIEDAKKIFFRKLDLLKDLPENASQDFKELDSSIRNYINSYLGTFTAFKGLSSRINLEKLESTWETKVSDFLFLYPRLHKYHQQKYIHANKINASSLVSLGSGIIDIARKDLFKLDNIKTEIPICVPLNN